MSQSCFEVRENKSPYFGAPRNVHEEYELILILEGRGQCFIGDHISDFTENQLVLLGPHLPHYWHNDKYYEETGIQAHYILVRFKKTFLGSDAFLNLLETEELKRLLDHAELGLRFDMISDRTIQNLKELPYIQGLSSITTLLQVLDDLSKHKVYETLSNPGFTKSNVKKDNRRIDKVYEYIADSFQEHISLQEVSELVHLSDSAFCQFFKKSTGKSFFKVVNEVRINHCCKQLANTDKSVATVCYEAGYNNVANFNRRFKENTKMSPLQYRKLHQEKLKHRALIDQLMPQ